MKRVVIVGGGFGGLNCAKRLARRTDVEVCLLDRRNYHLFQPLLYQVAMAGLSPADIASPIRGLFSHQGNVQVIQAEVTSVDPHGQTLQSTAGTLRYDYLVLAAGAQHAYFGNEQWEENAPGLKNLAQATEIRRRVLGAFEQAECEQDESRRRALLTFAVVGGGPTGVELAGAIGEMTRFTLARDFRHINPKRTRIVLIEAGGRVLKSFHTSLSEKVTSELERLGVQIWTNCRVTNVTEDGVFVGSEHLAARTVIWAAGVQASPLGASLGQEQDRQGRVVVKADLSLPGHPEVLIVGDQAHFRAPHMAAALPGVASVAIQQGAHAARVISADLEGKRRTAFKFLDKGQMATIGRRRAVMERGGLRTVGALAWFAWLLVHIYFLCGFRNRLFVMMHWMWSYLTFSRGARLIVEKRWHSYPKDADRSEDGVAPAERAAAAPTERAAAAPAPAMPPSAMPPEPASAAPPASARPPSPPAPASARHAPAPPPSVALAAAASAQRSVPPSLPPSPPGPPPSYGSRSSASHSAGSHSAVPASGAASTSRAPGRPRPLQPEPGRPVAGQVPPFQAGASAPTAGPAVEEYRSDPETGVWPSQSDKDWDEPTRTFVSPWDERS